ncbi:unnamed protein product, partial [Pneumocystis jirovecii]
DLYKLDSLIARFSREKSSVDTQLKAIVKDQFSIIHSGLILLSSTQQQMYSIRESMLRASKIYKNFDDVQKMTESLRNLPKELDKIDIMMRQDEDKATRMKNFLNIHYKLNQLQNFRDEAVYQSKNAGNDVQRTLERYFSRLNTSLKLFENMLWVLTQDILKIVKSGNHDLVVRLAKIIDTEDKLDNEFIESENLKVNNNDLFPKVIKSQRGPRVLRNYKQRFFDEIKISIDINLKDFEETYEFDYIAILENIYWIFDDLHLVKKEIVHLVPPKWNIFDIFLGFYHSGIYNILKNMVIQEPDAKTILKMLEFVKKYYSRINKEFGITRDKLTPRLLDGRESDFIDDYLKLIVKKMDEWISNLSKKEFNSFVIREEQPEVDTDNLYGMPGAVIMFQMISQQTDVAAESNQSRVLLGVVIECSRVLRRHRESWENLLHSEITKHIDQPNDVPGGLAEYIIALANDQIRCADYTEAISARISPWVSEKYKLHTQIFSHVSNSQTEIKNDFFDFLNKIELQEFVSIVQDSKLNIENNQKSILQLNAEIMQIRQTAKQSLAELEQQNLDLSKKISGSSDKITSDIIKNVANDVKESVTQNFSLQFKEQNQTLILEAKKANSTVITNIIEIYNHLNKQVLSVTKDHRESLSQFKTDVSAFTESINIAINSVKDSFAEVEELNKDQMKQLYESSLNFRKHVLDKINAETENINSIFDDEINNISKNVQTHCNNVLNKMSETEDL